ncbi:MAG TPA: TIGR03032 family protein [Rhizomicrobium sp.]|jgi:uncharacterized protein (TIGR03032 family)
MATADEKKDPFTLSSSRHFPGWLAGTGSSLAFSTYQAAKLFFLGSKPDGRLSVFERTFARCMGIGVAQSGQAFALATHYQIYRFDNVVPPGQKHGEHDALFAPHGAWITGDVDAHDIVLPPEGDPVFVNTLFSCLASVSVSHSFRPVWRPPFISKLAAEDRCHMNGLAVENGVPRYVSMVSASNVTDGWRDRRTNGGLVIDVQTGERMVEGLSMPHSPRLHGGKLWVLNSGAGEFGYIDGGKFIAIAFCPGYARGLTFVGDHAIIGLSLARKNRTFTGLPLDDALEKNGAEPRCGLIVVDTKTGDTTHWVRIEGVVSELYDVAVIPGVRNAAVVGFKTDEIHHVISIDER